MIATALHWGVRFRKITLGGKAPFFTIFQQLMQRMIDAVLAYAQTGAAGASQQ